MRFHGETTMKMRIGLALVLLTLAGIANAQVIDGPDYVYVSGEASTKVMPDKFSVGLSVSRTSQDVDGARRDIEEQVRNFVSQSRGAGIQEDDIDVRDLSVERIEKEDEKSGKLTYIGHSIGRNLQFDFRNVQSLRKFLSAIRMTRDVEIELDDPSVENEGEVRRKLLMEAVRSARANADLLATAAGRRLGPAHTVSDKPIRVRVDNSGTTLDSVTVTGTRMRRESADNDLPVVVEPKSVEITATAYAIFRLID
jgi:uncharacterized protein YggE